MCAIAASSPSTTFTLRIKSPYSVAQSSSPAAFTPLDSAIARVRSHPRTSTPAANNAATIAGKNFAATSASINKVSAELHAAG